MAEANRVRLPRRSFGEGGLILPGHSRGHRPRLQLLTVHRSLGEGGTTQPLNLSFGRNRSIDPFSNSIGGIFFRNRRAPAVPFNSQEPFSIRSQAPSRNPITGVEFSSRNCWIRS